MRDSELSIVLAFGEELAGTGKPLVVAGSIGTPTNVGRAGRIGAPVSLGRPATEDDPALPSGPMDEGTLVSRNVVESTVVGLPERGVRSSVVRIPLIVHSSTGRLQMIGLAKEKGSVGYAGDGQNRWPAVHIRDLASLFRLALENAPRRQNVARDRRRGYPVSYACRGRCRSHGPARGEHPR